MKLSTAVQQFLVDARLTLAPATVTAYESDLNLLVSCAAIEATDSVLAFTPALVRAYFLALSKKNLSMSTLHRRRASVAEFARWGIRRRLWMQDPMAELPKIARPKHLPRPFTHEERGRLMALALDEPIERVIRGLLFWLGLRVSEVCGIRLEDIAEGDGVTLGTVRVLGKGRKERVVPMVPELRALLHDYVWTYTNLDPRSFLLRQRDGRPWTRRMVEKRVRAWGRAAQVPNCTPHRWRHTTATMLLERGADPRRIQEFLGHADISTTMLYTQVTAQGLAAAAMLLSEVSKKAEA